MKKILFFFLFTICSATLWAQTNSQLKRAANDAFKMENYAASAKFYKQIIYNIDSGATGAAYPYGISIYEKSEAEDDQNGNDNNVVANDSTNSETEQANQEETPPEKLDDRTFALERLALSYYLLRSHENAEATYKQLYEINPQRFAYGYVKALMANEKYQMGIDKGNVALLELEIGSKEYVQLRDLIKSCAFAVQTIENTNDKILIKELDATINGTRGAFAANYGGEPGAIIFSSTHVSSSQVEQNAQTTDVNIYKASLGEGGTTQDDIQNISQFINTNDNEAAAVYSPDKTKLYFTRWTYNNKKPECAIYVSKFFNGQWLTARKLNDKINVPGYRSMHPALSADGKTLYFASDQPGGQGKMDIWYCRLDEKDNTDKVMNPGPAVNTIEDEATPYFHPNNFLYFSSSGHPGLGGLDIFKVKFDDRFVPPAKNMGSPINSSKDDAYYISDPEAQIGFFSSDRKKCEDCGEARCYEIYYFEDKPIIITISGQVYNEESLEPVPNSLIEFIDVKENYDPIFAFTDENGEYKTELIRDIEYFATAQKKGYFKSAVTVSTMGINQSTDLIQDFNFVLPPIPTGPIGISGIEYDLNSATLRDKSKIVLDTLVDLLTLNNNLVIKINSHTDERGNDDYNFRLSVARAKSVVDYLVEKGIEPERLESEGFGETKLLIEHATTEPEHQKNRRTEFDILSQDYQPVDKYQYMRKNR